MAAPLDEGRLGPLIAEHRFSPGERLAALVAIPLFALMAVAGFAWIAGGQGPLVGVIAAGFVVFFVVRLVRFRRMRVLFYARGIVEDRPGNRVVLPFDNVASFDWIVRKVHGFDQNHLILKAKKGPGMHLNETVERAADLGHLLAERLSDPRVVGGPLPVITRRS